MSAGDGTSRDFWGKLEITGRFLSTVVLVVIALVLERGATRISNSLDQGDLVRNLISDLTSRDSRARQDIALIALDHAVRPEDSLLVSEIAERIFWDLRDPETLEIGGESLGTMAFDILKRRNEQRAAEIEDSLRGIAVSSQSRLRSQLDPDAGVSASGQSDQARLLARAFSNVVYVQFQTEGDRGEVAHFAESLNDQGFTAPGIEHVDGDYEASVRYFHEEDRTLADSLASVARTFFEMADSTPEVVDLSQRGFSVPRGQLEVWLNGI